MQRLSLRANMIDDSWGPRQGANIHAERIMHLIYACTRKSTARAAGARRSRARLCYVKEKGCGLALAAMWSSGAGGGALISSICRMPLSRTRTILERAHGILVNILKASTHISA